MKKNTYMSIICFIIVNMCFIVGFDEIIGFITGLFYLLFGMFTGYKALKYELI